MIKKKICEQSYTASTGLVEGVTLPPCLGHEFVVRHRKGPATAVK